MAKTDAARLTAMAESLQADSLDAAAAVITKRPGPTQMQLHKLLYLVQAASLAWFDEAAFRGRIEAWKYGPMVMGVAGAYMDFESRPITEIRGDYDLSHLTDRAHWTVEKVVEEYGQLDGYKLADLVKKRAGTPWRLARAGVPDGADSREEIPLDVIRDYHSHHGVTWVSPSSEERPLIAKVKEGDSDALLELFAASGVRAVSN